MHILIYQICFNLWGDTSISRLNNESNAHRHPSQHSWNSSKEKAATKLYCSHDCTCIKCVNMRRVIILINSNFSGEKMSKKNLWLVYTHIYKLGTYGTAKGGDHFASVIQNFDSWGTRRYSLVVLSVDWHLHCRVSCDIWYFWRAHRLRMLCWVYRCLCRGFVTNPLMSVSANKTEIMLLRAVCWQFGGNMQQLQDGSSLTKPWKHGEKIKKKIRLSNMDLNTNQMLFKNSILQI